jgi:hypothetical protein
MRRPMSDVRFTFIPSNGVSMESVSSIMSIPIWRGWLRLLRFAALALTFLIMISCYRGTGLRGDADGDHGETGFETDDFDVSGEDSEMAGEDQGEEDAFLDDGDVTSDVKEDDEDASEPCPRYWSNTYMNTIWAGFIGKMAVRPVPSGGYIVGFFDHDGVFRLDACGRVLWAKEIREFPGEIVDIEAAPGGGVVILADHDRPSVEPSDAVLIKLDRNGNVTWQRRYGTAGYDHPGELLLLDDGGTMVAGSSSDDAWIVRLDESGSISWQASYGGPLPDAILSIRETSDGGTIAALSFVSTEDNIGDIWVMKLDAEGEVAWLMSYETTGFEYSVDVFQTSGGHYLLAGVLRQFSENESNAAWALKIDEGGGILWQKAYAGGRGRDAVAVAEAADGGYVLAGNVEWELVYDDDEVYLLKIDEDGGIVWSRNYGGDFSDDAFDLRPDRDGGLVVGGNTNSFTDPFNRDCWVMVTDGQGEIPADCPPRYGMEVAFEVVETDAVPVPYDVERRPLSLTVSEPSFALEDIEAF